MWYKVLILVFFVSSVVEALPLNEGFEGGVIPDNWTVINNDGDSYGWEAYQAPQYAHTGDWFATIHYGGTPNDDWLVTPRLAVDSGDVFYFWGRSRYASYPEAFNLLVSTSIAIDSFTDTLATVTNVPSTYTDYLYSLDAYVSDTIYIAIQSVSTNGMYFDVDDFLGPKIFPPATEETPKIPNTFALLQNLPNPMHTRTTIFYQLPKEAEVSIKIYNCAGGLVKTLVDEKLKPGYYSISWDGCDSKGRLLSSGIYFYKLESGAFNCTKKLILLR